MNDSLYFYTDISDKEKEMALDWYRKVEKGETPAPVQAPPPKPVPTAPARTTTSSKPTPTPTPTSAPPRERAPVVQIDLSSDEDDDALLLAADPTTSAAEVCPVCAASVAPGTMDSHLQDCLAM
jgi:hypothetical protein